MQSQRSSLKQNHQHPTPQDEQKQQDQSPSSASSFLTHAASLSNSDLSHSYSNFLSLSSSVLLAASSSSDFTHIQLEMNKSELKEKVERTLKEYIERKTKERREEEKKEEKREKEEGENKEKSQPQQHQQYPQQNSSAATSSTTLASFSNINPSPEESLLWGLLMGTLSSNADHETITQWWSVREAQLLKEESKRREKMRKEEAKRREEEERRRKNAPPSSSGKQRSSTVAGSTVNPAASSTALSSSSSSSSSTQPSPSIYPQPYTSANTSKATTNSTARPTISAQSTVEELQAMLTSAIPSSSSSTVTTAATAASPTSTSSTSISSSSTSAQHATRGFLLNSLALREEELRQMKTAQVMMKKEVERIESKEKKEKMLQVQSSTAAAAVEGSSQQQSRTSKSTTSFTTPHDLLCHRFILSLISASITNSQTLRQQNRVISDLKWSIAKLERIKMLEKNGSINRPLTSRTKWISSVSKPTPMPKGGVACEGTMQWTACEPVTAISEEERRTSNSMKKPKSQQQQLQQIVLAASQAQSQQQQQAASSDLIYRIKKKGSAQVEVVVQSPSQLSKEEESKSCDNDSDDPPTAFPPRDIRPGRGYTSTVYTPPLFDSSAALLAANTPGSVQPRMEVPKGVGVWSEGGRRKEKWHSAMTMRRTRGEEKQQTPEERAWKLLTERRLHAAAAATESTSPITSSPDRISLDSTHHFPLTRLYEDISLLGLPPQLDTVVNTGNSGSGGGVGGGNGTANDWHLITSPTRRLSMNSSSPATTASAISPTRRRPATAAVSRTTTKDPTLSHNTSHHHTQPSTHPFSDIPLRERPRNAYYGCTLTRPHPDGEGDMNSTMQKGMKRVERKLKEIGMVDQKFVRAMNLAQSDFQTYFHPQSNSWLPVDPHRVQARQCTAGCVKEQTNYMLAMTNPMDEESEEMAMSRVAKIIRSGSPKARKRPMSAEMTKQRMTNPPSPPSLMRTRSSMKQQMQRPTTARER